MSETQEVTSTRQIWLGRLQFGGVIALLILAVYFAQSPQVPPQTETVLGERVAPRVFVVRPNTTSHSLTVDLTGEVSLHRTIEIRPQVSGRVTYVSPNLRAGRTFDADEILLKIDRRELELDLQKALAIVDEQRARIRKHELKGEAAGRSFTAANPDLPIPDIVVHKPQIERFEARLRAALATVDAVQLDLSHTSLSLPLAGNVLRSQVAVGDLIGPLGIVGTAYTYDALEIEARVSSAELGAIGEIAGQPATAVVDGEHFDLVADRIAWELDQTSRLSTVLFKLTDASVSHVKPRPGAFAEITVHGAVRDDVYLLPNAARQLNDKVWFVQDRKVAEVAPAIQGRTETGWLVQSFDYGAGILVGSYPGVTLGSEVEALLQ